MSANALTTESEFRYLIQWFNEWSELQRDDFLPILVDYLTKGSPAVYVNGIISGLAGSTCSDKPMSLFQCRIKLFKDWSIKWPETFKTILTTKITEIDPDFGKKLTAELESPSTGHNGTDPHIQESINIIVINEEPIVPVVSVVAAPQPLIEIA